MESFKEITEISLQRASIISTERFSENIKSKNTENAPKDKYFFNGILFFFLGFSGLLCFTFFLTANDFWMYKFRDVSQPTYNSTNKTDLQIYFASATTISQSVPSLVATILTALYGHKIDIRTRILSILSISFLLFGATMATVLIDTDSWQIGFFSLTLFNYMVLTVAAIYFQVCHMSLISKFPPIYTKILLYGAGTSGMFGALLQITSLGLSNGSTTTAAMIYFTSGTLVIFIALVLAYLSKYSAFYTFYLGDSQIDTKRTVYTKQEIWEATKSSWSCLFIFSVSLIMPTIGHPNITCLIVSEYYDNGTEWSTKYFVPVITFLTPEIYSLLTRIIAKPIITKKNQNIILLIFLLKTIVLGPIYFFCRTSPKVHSPLWFPHDWQYILVIAASSSISTYFITISFLSIPRLAGKHTELAFILQQTYSGIVICLISPLGTFLLKLL